MLTTPLPSLEAWVSYLADRELPILQHTLRQLQALQGRADEISLHDIAGPINQDALLTLQVIRYLQHHRQHSQVTDVNTVDRVLMMIGTRGFVRHFGGTTILETVLAQHPDALAGTRRMLERATFAARIAERIAARRHDIDPSEVVTASLLHDTAEILLWLHAPALATQIEQLLSAHPGLRSRDAQRQVLGHTLFEIQLELVHRWRLPRLLAHLMDERQLTEPRVRLVMVAAALARHLANGWYDPALPDDYRAVADLTLLPHDAAYALVRDAAQHAARHWSGYQSLPALAMRPLEPRPGDIPTIPDAG